MAVAWVSVPSNPLTTHRVLYFLAVPSYSKSSRSLPNVPFSLPSKRSSREAEFRGWCEKNEDWLFHFEHDRERIFGRLMTAIHRVHPDLTFEFGPVEGGNREFVISADGHGAAFPAVEAVFAAAPSLPRWKFTKFRPRRPAMGLKIQ